MAVYHKDPRVNVNCNGVILMNKRIVALSDMHCGHKGGLTPAGWEIPIERDEDAYKLETSMWKEYRRMVREIKKFDGKLIVVCNGDAVDGSKEPWQLITGDRFDQVTMAQRCLQIWDADEYVFIQGTPYHTGKGDPWERDLAERFDTNLNDEIFMDINGKVFYFRHKIGGSGIPHGRHTQPAKQHFMNELDAIRGAAPRADVQCFGHVHYHTGAYGPDWESMSLPALQTVSSYGVRECGGRVDWGVVYFDVDKKGNHTVHRDIILLNILKKQPVVM